MFKDLAPAQLDPILSLTQAFREDTRDTKIDLGMYTSS